MIESQSGRIALDLLDRYLASECTSAEVESVEAWLRVHPDHKDVLRGMQALQIADGGLSPKDVDKAWRAFAVTSLRTTERAAKNHDRINVAPTTNNVRNSLPLPFRERRVFSRMTIAVGAATLLIGIVGGLIGRQLSSFVLDPRDHAMREFSTQKGQRATIQLADGSRVTLGPDSKIQLSSTFLSGSRTLILEGAAYFEVTHDPSAPFIVQSHDAIVQAIGTAFSVIQYQADTSVQVVVSQGRVAMRSETDDARKIHDGAIILSQGDAAEMFLHGGVDLRRSVNLARELGWANGKLVFRQIQFSEVVRILERWYDVSISVPDSALGAERVTATFDREGVADVLTQLTRVLGAQYRYNGRTILITRAH